MRHGFTSACLLVALAVTSPVAAQDPSDHERAVQLFGESRQAFEQGDYDRAARLSRRAYELSPNGDLLYNYARALDLAKTWDEAVAAYRQLVDRYPEHQKARFARQRIEEIETVQRRPAAPPATETALAAPQGPAPEAAARVPGSGATRCAVALAVGGHRDRR